MANFVNIDNTAQNFTEPMPFQHFTGNYANVISLLKDTTITTPEQCDALCKTNEKCEYWKFSSTNKCELYNSSSDFESGIKINPSLRNVGMSNIYSTTQPSTTPSSSTTVQDQNSCESSCDSTASCGAYSFDTSTKMCMLFTIGSSTSGNVGVTKSTYSYFVSTLIDTTNSIYGISGMTLNTDNTKLYITGQARIRVFDLNTNTISVVAGTGIAGFDTQTVSTSAKIDNPLGLAFYDNKLYIADTNNFAIRVVDLNSGTISTVAGSLGTQGNVNGIGTNALFRNPRAVAIKKDGTKLYVADSNMIRVIDLTNSNTVSLLTGNSTDAAGSTSGNTSIARFRGPRGITLSSDESILYVADTDNDMIRSINLSTNFTSSYPSGIILTPRGIVEIDRNLYVTNFSQNRIFILNKDTSSATFFAGKGTSGLTDGELSSATFNGPYDIKYDGYSLYISDYVGGTGICKVRTINLREKTVNFFIYVGTLSGNITLKGRLNTSLSAYSTISLLNKRTNANIGVRNYNDIINIGGDTYQNSSVVQIGDSILVTYGTYEETIIASAGTKDLYIDSATQILNNIIVKGRSVGFSNEVVDFFAIDEIQSSNYNEKFQVSSFTSSSGVSVSITNLTGEVDNYDFFMKYENESISNNLRINVLRPSITLTSVSATTNSITIQGSFVLPGSSSLINIYVNGTLQATCSQSEFAAGVTKTTSSSISSGNVQVKVTDDESISSGSLPITITIGNQQATGGTVTISGKTVFHRYETIGSFTFTPVSTLTNVEILIVGGGGGGGGPGNSYAGGGGGAGGFLYLQNQEITFNNASIPVIVGSGGSGGSSSQGTNGGDSVFGSSRAVGGGGGGGGTDSAMNYPAGAEWTNSPNSGKNGGSGGGEAAGNAIPGTGTSGQGNSGGSITASSNTRFSCAGGGGAGSAGGNVTTAGVGGAKGNGISNSITGTAYIYSCGGGGATVGASASTSGISIPANTENNQNGGNGALLRGSGNALGGNATGYGSGGGGGAVYGTGSTANASGGNGFQGVVYIKYTIV